MPDSLWSHGLQPTRLLYPWDFPGKDNGVGCHFLLQGVFPTQGWNPGLLHCRQILYRLSYKGSPFFKIITSNQRPFLAFWFPYKLILISKPRQIPYSGWSCLLTMLIPEPWLYYKVLILLHGLTFSSPSNCMYPNSSRIKTRSRCCELLSHSFGYLWSPLFLNSPTSNLAIKIQWALKGIHNLFVYILFLFA